MEKPKLTQQLAMKYAGIVGSNIYNSDTSFMRRQLTQIIEKLPIKYMSFATALKLSKEYSEDELTAFYHLAYKFKK